MLSHSVTPPYVRVRIGRFCRSRAAILCQHFREGIPEREHIAKAACNLPNRTLHQQGYRTPHGVAPSATLDACSSAPSATATWSWCARSGDCTVLVDIRSTSRVADTSTCSSRRSGDQRSRATRRLHAGCEWIVAPPGALPARQLSRNSEGGRHLLESRLNTVWLNARLTRRKRLS